MTNFYNPRSIDLGQIEPRWELLYVFSSSPSAETNNSIEHIKIDHNCHKGECQKSTMRKFRMLKMDYCLQGIEPRVGCEEFKEKNCSEEYECENEGGGGGGVSSEGWGSM